MSHIYTYNTAIYLNALGNKDIVVSRTIDESYDAEETWDNSAEPPAISEELLVFYNVNPQALKDIKKLHGYVKKPIHDGLVVANQQVDSKLLDSLINCSSGYEHVVFNVDRHAVDYKKTMLNDEQKAKLKEFFYEFSLDSIITVNLMIMIFYGATDQDVQKIAEEYLYTSYYNNLSPQARLVKRSDPKNILPYTIKLMY